jgi:nitroreductase
MSECAASDVASARRRQVDTASIGAMTADELEHLLSARHSCRAFLPQPVEAGIIERILSIAQLTPSWCNCQPWHVIVTRGVATERFSAELLAHARLAQRSPDIAFPKEYRGVYRERRRQCGWLLYDAVGVARGDREAAALQAEENYRLFGAPHVAIVTVEAALGTYGAVDCGGYVAMFLLAAQSLGIASVPQAALATYSPFVRAHFAIPPQRSVLCGISFGYENNAHPANAFRTPRAPLAEVLTWRD